MEPQISLHINNFNNKIKVMNQTQAKDLILSATDARNLHSAIFELLAQIADLSATKATATEDSAINVEMDGGTF